MRELGASAFIPGILMTSDWRGFVTSAVYRETAVIDAALKLFYHAPTFYAALASIRLWRGRHELGDHATRERYQIEFALWALSLSFLLLLALNRPQDYVHLAVLYFPFLLLALVQLQVWLRGRRVLALGLAAIFVWPASIATAYTGVLWWRIRTNHTAPIDSPRAGILVKPDQARLFDELLAYIRERSEPDDPVAVMPYFPILSFFAERRGPHRSSYIVWPFPEFPDRDRRVIDAIESTGTEVVIYNFTQFSIFNSVAEYAPELFEYLVDEWEIERLFTTGAWGYKLAALRRSREPRSADALFESGTPWNLSVREPWSPPRPVEPNEHREYARLSLWPFRPVLSMRPSLGGRTVLALPVEVPEGARLQTAVGIHPNRWSHPDAPWADFAVSVVENGERRVVYERRLWPGPRPEDRDWLDVDVPLDEWAGQRVTLEFSAETNAASAQTLQQAGWALPRLVVDGEPGAG
jgi:hypothetical protein